MMRACLWVGLLAGVAWSGGAFSAADELVELLRHNQTDALETHLERVQRDFEAGVLDEIALRNAFRPLYQLDPVSVTNLQRWAAASPDSYPAHLALGVHLKRRGLDARGERFIADTPAQNLDNMRRYLDEAESELRKSLRLTQKPYLSIFHLLDISTHFGDRATSKEWVTRANDLLPSNTLVRNRYLVSLLPRWGGSYEEVDAFIERSTDEGVAPTVIWQLQALKHQDLGSRLVERGDSAALAQFEQALELGSKAGGTFTADFLAVSVRYSCSGRRSNHCP